MKSPQRALPSVRDVAGAPAAPARRLTLTSAALVGAAVVFVVGLTVIVGLHPRTSTAQTVGDLSILTAALLAVLGCLRAARRGGPDARGWAVLAVAMAVWSTGQVVWTSYGITRQHLYPFPSLADAGFLGYSLPAVAALLLFPRVGNRRMSRPRLLLDALVIATATLFVSWATVLGALYHADGSGPSRAVGLAYPVIDVSVASLVLALCARVPAGSRRPWLLLSSGLVLLAVTDSTYVASTLRGDTGSTGTVLASGWVTAFLLIGFASQARPGVATGAKQRHFSVGQELLPYAPVLAAVVAALHRFEHGDPFLIVNGLLVTLLLLVQQVMIAIEKVALANSLEDTVERRTAELVSADERFRALVHSSDDAILSTTTDGVITSWNPAAERLYGYSAEEAIGRPSTINVPEQRLGEELEILAQVGQGAQLRSFETERVRKDATQVPVALTISPIYDNGVVRGISAIGRDISERRRHEAALTSARTEALEASRAKSQFLATMSHEIRTPMNGVIGLTGLLLDTPLDEVQRRYAAGVRGAGEALLGIIDDILDFSKLEAGKVDLEHAEFDPRRLVEDVGVLLAGAANAKGLELVAYCEPDVPAALLGDAGRLRQVLINLAANAVKFTAAGEVVLRVRVSAEGPTEQQWVAFEVSDTGIGIDPADQARLFEPFSQADASTTRRFGGTGLGLAICRRLVQAMGGVISLDSELDVGSCFRFAVPLPAQPPTTALASAAPGLLRGLQVLIVDDNATNRLILASQLGAWEMSVDLAADAHEALQLLHRSVADRQPYAVAVLDQCMPGIDGLDLAATMAARPDLRGIPTMILTSAGTMDRGRASSAGVREFISKPVRVSELHEALVRTAVLTVAPAATAVPPAQSAATGPVRRGRVLVVEDNEVNKIVTSGILTKLGYAADLAGDGVQALTALGTRAYDAVLMDCHMPRMDGFEATAELRRREGDGRRTPVIAMTAGVLAEDRQRPAGPSTVPMGRRTARTGRQRARDRVPARPETARTSGARRRRGPAEGVTQHRPGRRLGAAARGDRGVRAGRSRQSQRAARRGDRGGPGGRRGARAPVARVGRKPRCRSGSDRLRAARGARRRRLPAGGDGPARPGRDGAGLGLRGAVRRTGAAVTRILVADDDLGSRLVAQATVEGFGHECVSAADGVEAWRLYQELRPDVLVTDRAMPGLDGVTLCRRIRADPSDGYTYIVLVTGLADPQDVLLGMQAGADDYVAKPLKPFELQTRLLAAQRVTDLHAELARARTELKRQAHTDPLTGLRNRLGLASDLEQIHTVSQRYGRSYCVSLCDIDHFKRYNDTYGHLAGDQALRTVGATLVDELRRGDRVYRYGGEEFLVLLPEQSLDGAFIALERLRARLEGLAVEHRAGGPAGVLTMSVGLAACIPGHRRGSDELVNDADVALYEAKRAGRNRVVAGPAAGAPVMLTPVRR